MVHLTSGEGIGLLPRVSISIAILQLRAVVGVVPSLPPLVTDNMAQVLLGRGCWVGAVLATAYSILVSIICFRTIIGIVSSLPALETSNVTQILPVGCC